MNANIMKTQLFHKFLSMTPQRSFKIISGHLFYLRLTFTPIFWVGIQSHQNYT